MVNGDFFRLLDVEPTIGRGFLPEEDRVAGRDAVAVLSHATWQQEFAADPSVIGRTLYIAGIEFTVIGVAPEDFTGLHPYIQEAAFVPLAMWPRVMSLPHVNPLTERGYRYLTVKGRLKPGVTLSKAQAELAAIGKALEQAYPDSNARQAVVAQTELEVRFERRPLDSWLMVVLTTLAFAVLCVACANVAGLLASRAPVRAREIALRMAVGAGRARLVRQLITESFGIALAGGICGLAVGHVGIVLLRQITFPTEVASMPLLELNQRALVFSMAVAMASAVLFGLGPAIQTTRVNLVSALKTTDADTTRRQRLTGRNLLVAVQVALSLVLVSVSVWAFDVFGRAFAEGPGFRTARMAKLTIDPSQARYSEPGSMQFFERVVEEARRLPGVQAATRRLRDATLLVRVHADRPRGLPPARGADERALVLEQHRRELLRDDGDSDAVGTRAARERSVGQRACRGGQRNAGPAVLARRKRRRKSLSDRRRTRTRDGAAVGRDRRGRTSQHLRLLR